MLTDIQKQEIREALDNSERPFFIFDDDADGLCSFLQFYKHAQKGKGIVVKSTPRVDERHIKSVKDYSPDAIFILDLAMVDEEFIRSVTAPIYWIDHHELQEPKGVKYYNPKQNIEGDNTCISKLSYDIFGEHLWIAGTGTIGDWQLPDDLKKELIETYPDYLAESIVKPDDALFDSTFGELAKIMNFALKGDMKNVKQNIKILSRIDKPQELLEETTEQGKKIRKMIKRFYDEYDGLLARAEKCFSEDDKLLLFTYDENKVSVSGELSNELLHKYPSKIIIVARHHNGEMKTSFRSGKDISVHDILSRAVEGIQGRVGGHAQACGGVITDTDWDQFIENIREIIS